MKNRRTLGRGFTLIELLVVVSIILLLIAILLPSLKTAREHARRAVCLANLKGIALSSMTYATSDQHENPIPIHPLTFDAPIDYGTYDWGGKSGRGEPVAGTDDLSSAWGTSLGRGPGSRPLNRVVFKNDPTDFRNDPGDGNANWRGDTTADLPLFRCPSDRGYTGHHLRPWIESGLSSYDHYGTSYAANGLWCSGHLPSWSGYRSWSPIFHPTSRVPNPANTLLYMENAGRFGYHLNYTSDQQSECATNADGPYFSTSDDHSVIGGWHKRDFRFSAAFVDGHADTVVMNGHTSPAPRVSGIADAHPLYECHVIRGPGWQIDILPSAPTTMPFPEHSFAVVPPNLIH
jgi:prepilin-type N-terminal cleavage/methylation domain-containing protein